MIETMSPAPIGKYPVALQARVGVSHYEALVALAEHRGPGTSHAQLLREMIGETIREELPAKADELGFTARHSVPGAADQSDDAVA